MNTPPTQDDTPLFVDLDGTLVRTDVSVESAFALVRRNLGYAFALAFWLLRGRAYLKRHIADHIDLDVAHLPYIEGFVQYLRAQRAAGRRLILATAADQRHARQVADHLGIFETVLGSDGRVDLAGRRKLDKVRSIVGDGPFDYAADDLADLWIFPHARRVIVVDPVPPVRLRAERLDNVERVFDAEARTIGQLVSALRPGRWAMNLLIALPLAWNSQSAATAWPEVVLAILSFSLAASAHYVFDDLLHLPARRRLPLAARGAIAAGAVAIQRAAMAIPVLLALAFTVAAWLPAGVSAALVGYVALATLSAQDWFKCPRPIAAATLSALRVVAGLSLLSGLSGLWMCLLGAGVGAALELMRRTKTGYI